MHVAEGSSSTQHVREAEHASRRRERLLRMVEDGVVPRRRAARGRCVDVEPQPEPEHEQEYEDMDMQQQQMEEEELEAMMEYGEDDDPRRGEASHSS